MGFIVRFRPIFYLIEFTWGILMNLIGLVVSLAMLVSGHRPHAFGNGWYFVTRAKGWGGVSFGICTLCCPEGVTEYLLCHEAGHSIQNLFMGPFFPFLVGLPSVVRYWYRANLQKKGITPKTGYDDIWFEGQATKLGTKYFARKESD